MKSKSLKSTSQKTAFSQKIIFKQLASSCLGLAIALTGFGVLSEVGEAQSRPMQIAQQSSGVRYVRRNPSGPPAGGRYRGGGTRSLTNSENEKGCPAVNPPLTALVPFEETPRSQPGQPPITDVWGYTTQEHPTMWFYMPYTGRAIPASFSIQEEISSTIIYETPVALPKQAGIISIALPPNKPGLQIGKRYRWFFGVDCKSPAASAAAQDAIYVEGVIIRDSMASAMANRVATAKPDEEAAIYAENGFWFDAVTTLAKLRQQRPQDQILADNWKTLISSMSLSASSRSIDWKSDFNAADIASKPFAQ